MEAAGGTRVAHASSAPTSVDAAPRAPHVPIGPVFHPASDSSKRRIFQARTASGLGDAVGTTPLIELRSVSRLTGCRILGKAEHLGAGGSVKDRPAAHMLATAAATGQLPSKEDGGFIVEATGGNTGVGLAFVAAAMGFPCTLVMNNTVSLEKRRLMQAAGANVITVPPAPFTDTQNNFYHIAARIVEESGGKAFWTNQFENTANAMSHYLTTGPEVWQQTDGKIDAFICSAGTGGTIAGMSMYLKDMRESIQVYLIDPPGSCLAGYQRTGRLDQPVPGEAHVLEGVGTGRITGNYALARIDGAFDASEREAVEMAYWLAKNEGIVVGPSAAMNVTGAVKLARKLGPGHTIVTVLCDGAERNGSKLYNEKYLASKGLTPVATDSKDLSFVS